MSDMGSMGNRELVRSINEKIVSSKSLSPLTLLVMGFLTHRLSETTDLLDRAIDALDTENTPHALKARQDILEQGKEILQSDGDL